MKISPVLASLLCAVLASCAANPNAIANHHGHIKAGDPGKISLGMTRLEVMRVLGQPENVSADVNGETLTYMLERPWWQDKPFCIELHDNKVTAFKVVESKKEK